MADGALSAISRSSRQISCKASEPVLNRVRPEQGWHSRIIAVIPMRDVTLNQQEQAMIQVLNSVLEYQLPIAQAAGILARLCAISGGVGEGVHHSVVQSHR